MDKNRVERNMLRLAVILAAVALILVCFALIQEVGLFWRVVLLVCAAIVLAPAGFLIYLLILGRRVMKGEHNFFLYDTKKRANIPIEELTSDIVSGRVVRYMALFQTRKRLYLSSLFDEEGGAPEIFKPLFCYQLLGMLSVTEGDEQLGAFLSCGKELADAFSTYLAEAEEEELSREIQRHIAQYDGKNVSEFRTYLSQKSEYLAERMLAYTKKHIREFD